MSATQKVRMLGVRRKGKWAEWWALVESVMVYFLKDGLEAKMTMLTS